MDALPPSSHAEEDDPVKLMPASSFTHPLILARLDCFCFTLKSPVSKPYDQPINHLAHSWNLLGFERMHVEITDER